MSFLDWPSTVVGAVFLRGERQRRAVELALEAAAEGDDSEEQEQHEP